MKDVFFSSLVIINVVLPLILAYYLYVTKEYRTSKETLYAVLIFLILAYRNIWIFVKYIYEINNDLLLRFTALAISFLLYLCNLWIRHAFPIVTSNFRIKKTINGIFWFSMGFSLLLMPLSILLPPDMTRNDMSFFLAVFFGIFQLVLVLQGGLRIGVVWRNLSNELQWYYFVLFFGVVLIIFSNLLFFWLDQAILHQVAPMVGYIIVLFALIATRVFPLFQFATTIDAGIILVNQDYGVVYTNKKSRQFIDPKDLKDNKPIKLVDLWPDKEKSIIKAFNTVIRELRSVQVEEKLNNYAKGTVQNIQLTFYPLGAQNLMGDSIRVGIMLLYSDEMEFLKLRKDFLFDIATHDIANVCQTLQFSHGSLSRKDFLDENAYQIFQLAKKQSNRLAQLTYSVQNLLIIDEISSFPSEEYPDFNERLEILITEKQQLNPDFEFIKERLSDLRPIKTTGNLKAGFSLLLDSVIETSDEKQIYITTEIDEIKQQQKVIFMFTGEELSESLLESYSNERKADLTRSGSAARVNLIVVRSIIQKNDGILTIEKSTTSKFSKKITVALPFYNSR